MTRWFRARFHAHAFHYRMPETAAINSVNPLVPSPSTVKLALLATLLDRGRVAEAGRLAGALDQIEVRVRPPAAAVVFRALLRYVRPPSKPPRTAGELDAGTAGHYKISPHYREVALWSEAVEVWVGTPGEVADLVAEGLPRIRYLGAKDSQVTCLACEAVDGPPPADAYVPLGPDGTPAQGVIVQLADVVKPLRVATAIPGGRRRGDFAIRPHVLPGRLVARGGTRHYFRDAGARRSGWTVVTA